MGDYGDQQPEDLPRDGEFSEPPETVSSVDRDDPEPTRGERMRRRAKQAVMGVGGAVGVAVLVWGANRLLKGEPEGSPYPAPRVLDGYSKSLAGPDGQPPAHWHAPASHDAMYRRVPGSFEMGKRR